MRPLLVVQNPGSRKGAADRETLFALLREAGFEPLGIPDELGPADYSKWIEQTASRAERVLIVGGDGSINACLAGLLSTELPFGVLPQGTANNFVRNQALPTELEGVLRVLVDGQVSKVDLASVNGLPFLTVCGLGISAEVNRTIPPLLKRVFGPIGYILHALRVFLGFGGFVAEIRSDEGFVQRARFLQLTICNGKFYGSALTVSPSATLRDGHLDLVASRASARWSLPKIWRVLRRLKRGTDPVPEVLHLRSTRFEVKTHRRLPVDVDGDLKSVSPLVVSLEARKLCILTAPAVMDSP